MEYIVDYYARLNERRRAAGGKSELLVYCLDLVEASLWSVAGGQDPQALVQLDTCLEVAFKAELDTIHRVLIADTRHLDYEQLKRLLREAFLAHPRGRQLHIADYDIEHTITFTEAKRRINDLVPIVKQRDRELDRFHKARNEIVHYGPDRARSGEYAQMIATIGFPVLAELLRDIGSVDFERLVTPPVWRELAVSRQVCDALIREGLAVGSYCLKTVRWRVLHDRVQWPHPDDEADSVELDEREHEMADRLRIRLQRRWDVFIERHCKICNWYPSFVAVEPQTQPARRLLPLAFECPKCGLRIDENDRFLAAFHIDDITHEETEELLRDIGE